MYNRNYNYYLLFRLLSETGMRIGELLNLDCEDLNVKKRYAEAEGKTGRKVYYFSEGFARHLEVYLKERMGKETASYRSGYLDSISFWFFLSIYMTLSKEFL
ncbi:MAG: tyrosine-type recombinase/integrase [Candidatus Lokiarchaeota archaeon]|nr:tyrosine-type recombinase/integrase [Candidatus Lokiarchaeota archaeon]MBD3201258.1 tyrosine-type recombinase/integrase [Candidatus Lokiarchaeota archaeon]